MQVEVWTKSGNLSRESQLLRNLTLFLQSTLVPGTALEGVWLEKEGLFYIYDVTYHGVENSKLDIRPSLTADLEKDRERADQNNQLVAYSNPDENRAVGEKLSLAGDLAQIRLVDKIESYYPGLPDEGSPKMLKFPPDDWSLELKVKGERVVFVLQPQKLHKAMDLRFTSYDLRVKTREKLIKRLDCSQVKVIPTFIAGFPRAYEGWKCHPHADGVILKQRNAQYPLGQKAPLQSKVWRKLEYEPSERKA